MNTYVIYYGEPDQPPTPIPVACEVNLVALYEPDKGNYFTVREGTDGKGKMIAVFENRLIRAIVDEGERVYGANKVQTEIKRRLDAETVNAVSGFGRVK
jgi:hypothetical protein